MLADLDAEIAEVNKEQGGDITPVGQPDDGSQPVQSDDTDTYNEDGSKKDEADSEEQSDEKDQEGESEEEDAEGEEESEGQESEDDQQPEDKTSKNKQDKFIAKIAGSQRQIEKAITSLTTIVQSLAKNQRTDTPAQQEQKLDEIDAYLEEVKKADPNANVEALKAFAETIEKSIRSKIKLPDNIGEVVKTVTQKQDEEQEAVAFQKEWEEFLPDLQKQFPNASKEQLQAAANLMDDLSHTEKYGWTDKHAPYTLDYILFKEQEAFKKVLFRPKVKTFEAGGSGADDYDDMPQAKVLDTKYEDMTPDTVRKMEAELDQATSESRVLELNRGGKKIKVRT